MNNHTHPIDLVYLWVDGNDPEWIAKKIKYTGAIGDGSEGDCVGRYISNDELKYALRSADQYAPWLRHIYIVTDNQQPEWLDVSHPKIKLVDHKEILPPEIIPSFSAQVIEYFLYRIPGLSEHFLYANDDMFFNAPLPPSYFFTTEGLPIVRLKRKPLAKWRYRVKRLIGKKLGQYAHALANAASMVEKKFGKYYSGVPHHNIDSYRKSDYQNAVEDVFKDQVATSQGNRTRAHGDLQRSAFAFYALAIGNARLKYVGRKESSRILVYKHDFAKYMEKYQPELFCLNDNQHVTEEDRLKIKPFLEAIFPKQSAFEK